MIRKVILLIRKEHVDRFKININNCRCKLFLTVEECLRLIYLCLPLLALKFWPSMSHKMSKRGGTSTLRHNRGKSGSRVNLPLKGGSALGWDFRGRGSDPGGSESTTPVLNMYSYHIQVLAHFFVHIFFQSALTSSISTQFEYFKVRKAGPKFNPLRKKNFKVR